MLLPLTLIQVVAQLLAKRVWIVRQLLGGLPPVPAPPPQQEACRAEGMVDACPLTRLKGEMVTEPI